MLEIYLIWWPPNVFWPPFMYSIKSRLKVKVELVKCVLNSAFDNVQIAI